MFRLLENHAANQMKTGFCFRTGSGFRVEGWNIERLLNTGLGVYGTAVI